MFKKYKDQFYRVVVWNSIARQDELPNVKNQIEICEEEVQEYYDAATAIEDLDAICDVFVTGSFLEFISPRHPYLKEMYKVFDEGIDRYGEELVMVCLEEVLRSNDTKFLENKMGLDLHMEVYLLEKDTGLKISVVENKGKVIFLDENGKIRKPQTYSPPQLRDIVNEFLFKK